MDRNPIKTVFTDDLLRLINMRANERTISAIKSNCADSSHRDPVKKNGDDWIGAAGEIVVAMIVGVFPYQHHARFDKRVPDVLPWYEVRTVRNDAANLFVYPRDLVDRIYILNVAYRDHILTKGWISGREIQRNAAAWFYGPGELNENIASALYCVPHDALQAMGELPGITHLLTEGADHTRELLAFAVSTGKRSPRFGVPETLQDETDPSPELALQDGTE